MPFCRVTVEELQGNPKPLKTLKPETLMGFRGLGFGGLGCK